jgi:pimeloyl-ACP methyl ester carboxylesterase
MPVSKTASGAEIFYEDLWVGRPWLKPETVMLVHGSSECGRAWFSWLPRMSAEFRTLVPDLPGFGNSPPVRGFKWSLEAICATLAGFLDSIDAGPVHFVGAKVGGAVGFQFASQFPDRVKSLTVLAAPVRYPTFHAPPLTSDRKQWIEESQRLRLGTEVPPEQFAYWNRMMMGMDQASREGLLGLAKTLDLEPLLPGITAPVLVITSDKGTAVPLEDAFRYYQKLPNGRLLVIPSRAYHTAAAQPDQCLRNVIPFIKGELD